MVMLNCGAINNVLVGCEIHIYKNDTKIGCISMIKVGFMPYLQEYEIGGFVCDRKKGCVWRMTLKEKQLIDFIENRKIQKDGFTMMITK